MKILLRVLAFTLVALLCLPMFSCEENTDIINESLASDKQTTIHNITRNFPPEYSYLTMLLVSVDISRSYNISSDIIFRVQLGSKKSNMIVKPSYAVLEIRNGTKGYSIYSPEVLAEYPYLKSDYQTVTSLIYSFRYDNYSDYPEWDYVASEYGGWELVTPLTVNINLRGDQLTGLTGSIVFILFVYDKSDTMIGSCVRIILSPSQLAKVSSPRTFSGHSITQR